MTGVKRCKNRHVPIYLFPNNTHIENDYTIGDGNIKVVTSHNGEYTIVGYYDAFGRIEKNSVLNQSEEVTQAEYVHSGDKLVCTEYPNGNIIFYFYDYMDRLSWTQNYDEINAWNSYNSYVFNDYENTKTVTYGGISSKIYYDDAGRIVKKEQNGSAGCSIISYEYDNRGNIIKTTDGLGRSTTNTYNDLDQLLSSTNPIGQTTNYEYDAKNNLTNVSYHNNTMDYTYDSINRLISATDVLGNTEYYAYDKNNNLVNHKDKNSNITTYTYDIMNRLISDTTGSVNTSYTYDNLGNVNTMTDSTGTTSYFYDYAMNVSSITTPDNKSITYSYDDIGNIIGMVDYAGNEYEYMYDIKYRLSQINLNDAKITQYNYTDFDYIESVIYPNYTESYQYDDAAIITSKSIVCPSDSIEYSYTYDLVGNQLKKTETYNETESVTNYTYDALNRLTSMQEQDGTTTTYTFDTGNNIMTKSITHPSACEFSFTQDGEEHTINNISTHNYTYSYDKANRLMTSTESIAGTGDTYSGYLEIVNSFTYDNNGNTLSKTTGGQVDESMVQYGYNELNQLISFTDASGNITNYGYDGTGMRVSKTQGDTIQRYYWDRGYIVNEGDAHSIMATNHVGLQGVFARQTNGTDYLIKNGHGDTSYTLNGDIVDNEYEYDAYGLEKETDAQDSNPFRYCGEYYDDESGLIYLRNRYYDPSMGRFITEDPVMDGNNWYVYCGNNPIRYIDPTGYITQEEIDRYENGEMAPSAYTYLMTLTYEWYLAHTDEERDYYHNLADDFRNNNYLTTGGEFPDIDAGIDYMDSLPDDYGGVIPLSIEEHYFRNELNIQYSWDDFQKLQEALPDDLQWYVEEKDDLHQHHTVNNQDNVKYVSACGHFEAVYNADNILLTQYNNPDDMGTYNYYSPDNWIGHYTYDIYPYKSFGWFGWGLGNVPR